ncbi:hypothetical protein [Pectobacterium carotovorum]|uniref:hypothetical protein n=1 Tax=Pectobacterium carotovorum TaxID=554 RepID=UPI00027E0B73|nr:hypothetical protein [Pectobacterium carotovorum]AFR03298.1 putative bacteriophage protein [Pectobacterium carotovorum subsp. carotovorum PCC21]
MSVDHACFLDLASESLDGKNREIDFRNSISRSYYSLYHSALRLTKGNIANTNSSGNPYPGGMHKRFYSYLIDNAADNHGLDKEKTVKVGLALKQAHALRIAADYLLEQRISRPTAEMAYKKALEINTLIEDINK